MSDLPSTPSTTAIDSHYDTNAFGERYLRAINRSNFESASAVESYQKRFGDTLWATNTLYIILGTDSGLLPEYIINHGIPEGTRYLFIELDEIVPYLRSTATDKLAPRILITPYSQWLNAIKKVALHKYTYSGHVNLLRASAAQPGHYSGYLPLTQEVETELRQQIWRLTSQFDLRIHAKTQLANLAENRHPAACLRNTFRERSGCLLAAGPSLDEMIPWIKSHRNELALICVSRVAGLLRKHEIVPDIIVTADPQKLSYTVSKEMLKFGECTLLVNADSASPHLVGQWYGPSLYLKNEYPWQVDSRNENIGVTAPTVTNTALNLMLEMGFSEIILAGVDLCYSQEGHSHATGSIEREHGPLSTHVDLTLETNNGHQAETNRGYYAAIEAFAEQAKQARPYCKIINPAANAAKIEQIEHIPLASLSITHPLGKRAWEILQSIIPQENAADRRTSYQTKLKELDLALSKLRKMKKLASTALTLNNKLVNDDGQTICVKKRRKLDQIETRLSRNHADMDPLVKLFNGREFASAFSGKAPEEKTISDVISQGSAYYRAYINGTEEVIEQINHCKIRLESRLDEEREAPDFKKLFQYWTDHDEGARAIVWKRRHADLFSALPKEIQEQFEQLIKRYEAGALRDDSQYRAFGKSEKAFNLIMGQVIDKAIEHFHHNNIDGLKRIFNGLSQRPEPQAKEIAQLVAGFIHEVEGDIDKALHQYKNQNGDLLWTTKQFGLERSLEIQMQREDSGAALESLKQLSQRIDSYTPLYAQLLEVTGAIGAAGDIYGEWMKRHPRDIDIATEYGQFLLRYGADEGAQAVLDHMLQIDAHHAQTLALQQRLQQHRDATRISANR